jgi:hypothetical protein
MPTELKRPKRNTQSYSKEELERRIDLACEVLGIHFTEGVKELSTQRRHVLNAMVSQDAGGGSPRHYRIDTAFNMSGGTSSFIMYRSLPVLLKDPEFADQWEKAKDEYRAAVQCLPFVAKRCMTEGEFVNNRIDVALACLGVERAKLYQWCDDGRMTCGKKGHAIIRAKAMVLVDQRVGVFNVPRFTLAKALGTHLETVRRWEDIFYKKMRVEEPEVWADFYDRLVPMYREGVIASEAN